MAKLIYIDTETTGLDAETNALTQVAALVVVDGVEVGRLVLDINPFSYPYPVGISDKALEITGKTKEMVREYPDQRVQLHKFMEFMDGHIDFEDKKDRFQIVGYNTSFDIGFLKQWLKLNDKYMSNFFTYKDVDVFALVKHMRLWGVLNGCKDDKLGTVCEFFNIELDAHDAMNDIVATRELYKMLMRELQLDTVIDVGVMGSIV